MLHENNIDRGLFIALTSDLTDTSEDSKMNQVPVDTLFTERDLAVYLGLSLPTLQRQRAAGTGPRFIQLSERRIAYRRADVDAWLAARTTDRIGGVDVQQYVGPLPFAASGEAA